MSKENKTQPTSEDVTNFFNSVEPEQKRLEAIELDQIFRKATGEPPVMWGASIVGYGTYHYKYATGREGDFMRAGFSPRKAKHSIYIMGGHDRFANLFENLGKYKTGKSCVYVNKLSDIDADVLEQLIRQSYEYIGNKQWP